jgi:hypothetical protein
LAFNSTGYLLGDYGLTNVTDVGCWRRAANDAIGLYKLRSSYEYITVPCDLSGDIHTQTLKFQASGLPIL